MQTNAVRRMCYAIILAIVTSIAPVSLSTPVNAQLMPTYSVGVIDFTNVSGVKGDILSRLATDAVVVELSKTNRYDVGITRSQIKSEMDKLDLRAPLSRVDVVRLGESLSADAILEGTIQSVKLTGSGANRSAAVTIVTQMIDQASGETINGAVQTGNSAARVGFEADDETLITEAINKAAFLAVRQMVDYVIPEATIQMNVGADQVMLNRGSRDGIKPGMKMLVIRRKEVLGYIEVQSVDPINSNAKILKSLRGIQPEDKARAIYDMPSVASLESGKPEILPSSAPNDNAFKTGSISKIGRFVVAAAIVYGFASLFRGGRGSEDAPIISTGASNTILRWDPTKYNHGQNVKEYQVLRDDFSDTAVPVRVISDPTLVDSGKTDVRSLYGTTAPIAVTYSTLVTNPSTTAPISKTGSIPAEDFGIQHTYQLRVLYGVSTTLGSTTTVAYYFTPASQAVRITAIQPVLTTDLISPAYDPAAAPEEIQIGDLRAEGDTTFQWNRKPGGNAYYIVVKSMVPGVTGIFNSKNYGEIFESGPVVELTAAQRVALADFLTRSKINTSTVLEWQVFTRNTEDSKVSYTAGEKGRFTVGDVPPPSP